MISITPWWPLLDIIVLTICIVLKRVEICSYVTNVLRTQTMWLTKCTMCNQRSVTGIGCDDACTRRYQKCWKKCVCSVSMCNYRCYVYMNIFVMIDRLSDNVRILCQSVMPAIMWWHLCVWPDEMWFTESLYVLRDFSDPNTRMDRLQCLKTPFSELLTNCT